MFLLTHQKLVARESWISNDSQSVTMSFDQNRIRTNTQSVQKLLDENTQLIQAIVDYQNKGKAVECVQYQQLLHKNLVYLATLADTSQNIQAMIPPPPSSQMQGSPSPSLGMSVGGHHDRRPMDSQNAPPGLPNMIMSQANTPAMAQVPRSTMSPGSVMTSSEEINPGGPYGVASVPSMKTSNSSPVTGFNPSQMVGSNMAVPSSQSMLPGQQTYMSPMLPGQAMPQHPQAQQFMMQQNLPMGYSTGPGQQMHPSQQPSAQLGQPSYIPPNQGGMSGQQPAGMMPYQQPPTGTYDPYSQMQNMPGYNNPYGQQ